MKKHILFFSFFLFTVFSSFAYAQTEGAESAAVQRPVSKTEKMVNLTGSTQADIRDLERRVTHLDRDQRYLNDRIRNLERTVDDLRRRRSSSSGSSF